MNNTGAFISKLSKEDREHIKVVEYLKWCPTIFWHHTPNEGKRNWAAQKYNKLMGARKGMPDFMIFDPRGGYSGLAIELKAQDVIIYKKDGSLRKNEHIEAQNHVLEQLRKRGWRAEFAKGAVEAINLMSEYFAYKKDKF